MRFLLLTLAWAITSASAVDDRIENSSANVRLGSQRRHNPEVDGSGPKDESRDTQEEDGSIDEGVFILDKSATCDLLAGLTLPLSQRNEWVLGGRRWDEYCDGMDLFTDLVCPENPDVVNNWSLAVNHCVERTQPKPNSEDDALCFESCKDFLVSCCMVQAETSEKGDNPFEYILDAE